MSKRNGLVCAFLMFVACAVGFLAISGSANAAKPAPLCNDGTIGNHPSEKCEDLNTSNSDDCLSDCDLAACGDGFVHTANSDSVVFVEGLSANPLEECDDGNVEDSDGCSATCTNEVEPGCGDGVLQAGEECDDTNTDSLDGCDANCVKEFCGDGVDNNGDTEECDNGEANSDTEVDACRTDCTLATCRDGVVDTGEECDDGNNDNQDACSNTCKINLLVCGNGILEADVSETCDDGNIDDGDGCSATCIIEEVDGGDDTTDGGDDTTDGDTTDDDSDPDVNTNPDGTTDGNGATDGVNSVSTGGCSMIPQSGAMAGSAISLLIGLGALVVSRKRK